MSGCVISDISISSLSKQQLNHDQVIQLDSQNKQCNRFLQLRNITGVAAIVEVVLWCRLMSVFGSISHHAPCVSLLSKLSRPTVYSIKLIGILKTSIAVI